MCKCQGLKCKQFETYRTDENQAYECTCAITSQKIYLASCEIDGENEMDCPENGYDPKILEKCKGHLCKHFIEWDDGDGYEWNCQCEITDKWVDLWPEEFDKPNELDCPYKAFEPRED